MTDLIDRYLAAVGRNLPPRQAADIEAELKDELLARIEAKEAEVRRPLDRAQLVSLLKDFGHPLVVAARYRRTQALIGPEVYPFWLATTRAVLAVLSLTFVVMAAIGYVTSDDARVFGQAFASFLTAIFVTFGVITAAFAAFERFGKAAFLKDWEPRHLPPARRPGRRRFELAAEIVFDVAALAWWFGLFRVSDMLPAQLPQFFSLALAPVWAALKWQIAAYLLAEAGANLLALSRPAWSRVNSIVLIARYAYGVVIMGELLAAGRWVIAASTKIPPHALAIFQKNLDLGFRTGIVITLLAFAGRAAWEAWRLWRTAAPPGSAAAAAA